MNAPPHVILMAAFRFVGEDKGSVGHKVLSHQVKPVAPRRLLDEVESGHESGRVNVKSAADTPDTHEFVLLVDDDEELRQTLVELLDLDGIETITAGRLDEALKLVVLHKPAVVVVDYQLPDGSGIDLAKAGQSS